MATISNLNVMLTANIGGFASGMTTASKTLGGVRSAFTQATSSAATYESLLGSMGQLKVAGADTIQSLRGVLSAARAEITRFAHSTDVKVAIEIGREHIAESWIKARAVLKGLADRTGITVKAGVVADKARTAAAWLNRQRRAFTEPLMIRIGLASGRIDAVIATVRTRLEALKQYRAVRIMLAATNAIGPVAGAALRTLAPLRRLAVRGIVVVLRATHAGIATAVAKARGLLGGLARFSGGIVSKIMGGFGMLAMAAGAVGVGFVVLARGTMESMAATGRLADRMGITTQKLTGLQHAGAMAGVGTEEVTNGLEKMLHSLGEAATGSGTAAVAFAHLGLNAQQLANMSPDQAFTSIAEGLKNIGNPAERAAVAMEIFGKSGQNLLPLLMEGKEGIAAAQAEAEKLGISFNRVDAAKIEAANQSMKRLQSVFEGAIQTLVIQLAPFIDAIAGKLTDLGTSGQGAGGFITNGFNSVLSTLAKLADYMAVVQAGWQMLRSGASFAIGGIVDGLAYVLDGLDWLLKKLGQTATGWGATGHQVAQAFYGVGKEAFQKAGENFDTFMQGTNSKNAAHFMADVKDKSDKAARAIADNASKMNGSAASTEDWSKKLQKAAEDAKKVTETLADLHKEVDTFGMTEGQKKAFDLKALGATPAQIAEANKLADTLERLGNAKKATDSIKELQKELSQLGMTEAQKKMADLKLPGVDDATLKKVGELATKLEKMKEGQAIFDETRTPMEKYETQIGKLSDLLNSGAITWDTYGRAVRQAREQLEKANETKSPELFKSGTAEAQRYAYEQKNAKAFDATKGAQKQNANKDELAKQQYTEQYQSRLILQRIENKLTDSNADPVTTTDIA